MLGCDIIGYSYTYMIGKSRNNLNHLVDLHLLLLLCGGLAGCWGFLGRVTQSEV